MDRQELTKLVEEGLSIRSIASLLGTSYTAVRYWLKKFELKTRDKRRTRPPCKYCGKPVKRSLNQYCSCHCSGQARRRIVAEDDLGNVGVRLIKRYLLEKRGYLCQVCGITQWMGRPAPLELDHKDGDSLNNDLENLRLICPNCHAQTEAYKGRNRGRGRYYRRERYAQA